MTRTEATEPANAQPPTTPEQPPRKRALIIGLSVLAGFLLTVIWSAEFVDKTIGDNVANSLLGHDAKQTALSGITSGVVFAFVSGLAGTFTACNVAVFGAMAPMVGSGAQSRTSRARHALRPLGALAAGMVVVSGLYGAVVGLVGTRMPQFSTAQNVAGTLSPRSVQAMIVFGIVGLAMCYLGLAALRLVPDPFTRIEQRYPYARMVALGALIGGFLIGRPFPLFRQLFRAAAESGNPFYGAAAFILQSLGNVLLMAILLLAVAFFAGSRVQRWLLAKPGRTATITAAALITVGAFTFLYWDVRLLAGRGILPWYPVIHWG